MSCVQVPVEPHWGGYKTKKCNGDLLIEVKGKTWCEKLLKEDEIGNNREPP